MKNEEQTQITIHNMNNHLFSTGKSPRFVDNSFPKMVTTTFFMALLQVAGQDFVIRSAAWYSTDVHNWNLSNLNKTEYVVNMTKV